jgi:NTP pyrophosphatase (non-canonical NTP hydrolase)
MWYNKGRRVSDDSLWITELLGKLEDNMWTEDMNMMHEHYGVHDIINKMNKDKLRKFLKFRAECIQEEVDELDKAVRGKEVDAEETVDALIDICVFAIGTLDLFGVDGHKAWREVYEANMNKEIGIKKERPNPFGLPDLVKPKGWAPPIHIDNHGKLKDL